MASIWMRVASIQSGLVDGEMVLIDALEPCEVEMLALFLRHLPALVPGPGMILASRPGVWMAAGCQTVCLHCQLRYRVPYRLQVGRFEMQHVHARFMNHVVHTHSCRRVHAGVVPSLIASLNPENSPEA